MSIQWSTTSSGSWDEKYPQLDTGNPGLPSPIPAELIFYPENPGDPFIMKPVSHSWPDVSEMILHCVRRSQNIEYHCDQSLQFYHSITSVQNTKTILATYKWIYNHLFFGGMVKSSVVEESADDEIKIIFGLELVSDHVRARAVEMILDDGLGLTVGLTESVFDGRINHVTIYILDLATLYPERNYHEVISQMLGTLAHEMVHAMQFMYAKYPRDVLGIIYAPHGTHFQKAAKAIEQATCGPLGGEGWIYPKIELGRDWGVFYDVSDLNYREPTDAEIRNMGLDVEKLRGIFRERLPRTVRSIDQPSDFN